MRKDVLTRLIGVAFIVAGVFFMYQSMASSGALVASYYGAELAGATTASGEPFNPEGHTAAHPYMPLGTRLQVTHEDQTTEVVVNDRGPAAWTGHDIDLSRKAAEDVGLIEAGSGVVSVTEVGSERLGEAPSEAPAKESSAGPGGITKLPDTGGPRP